jgi:mannitol operon transcriptional antiterminator
MNVSNRTRQILDLLLRTDRDLTAAEIADDIHVSSRTVHRELAAAEEILRSQGIGLLKKSGSGIRLQGDADRLETLKLMISSSGDIEFSHDERQTLMLCSLLENDEPVKLFALAHDLKVTVPTVSSDLNELSEWVEKFGVMLVRKRGYGVMLSGPEERLRETIRQLIKLRFDDTELIASQDEIPLHPIHRELFTLAGKSLMADVENVLWNWEERWAGRLSENAYTDLLIRLSITLERIRAGKKVSLQADLGRDNNFTLQEESGALRLTKLLSERLDVDFTRAETVYISRLLNTIRADDLLSLPGDDLALTETVRSLISHVQNALGMDYSEDRSLRDGLFFHMKAAIQRLNDGMGIRNPLLDQIQKDYVDLFGIVREAVTSILPKLDVPDEEIGFLVMHFGAAFERFKQLRHEVRAILVCTNGIGSSKLLQIRLQKELPQIEIVNRVSWYEASRISEDKYDLIITTIDLPLDPSQYMKVSPLLTQGEADRLRSFIRDTTLSRKRTREPVGEAKRQLQSGFDQMLSLKTTLDEIVHLIEWFNVIDLWEESRELSTILEEACQYEEAKGVLSESTIVAKRLVEREQSGSQMIPGTTLALFHTRSPEIRRPSLSLYRMERPLAVNTVPPSILSQFLLMLAPQTLSWESLEVLSEISAMLLDSEMIERLEAGDETAIRNYLTVNLKTFFSTKTESE